MEFWFIYPLLSALLFSSVNYLDKFIIEKVSGNRGVGALILFSALAGIPVVLILSFLFPSQVLNIQLSNALLITLAGSLYLLGIIFYLYAIWEEDASSVVPQMLLIPCITLALGYLFLNETIQTSQILGGLLILAGSIILTYNFKSSSKAKLKIFLLILGTSFLTSINQLIFKYGIIEDISFWTILYWEHMGFILMALIIFVFVSKWRKDFFSILKKHGKLAFWTNTAGEVINIIGNTSLHYGAIFAPVGLVALVGEGVQPLILLIMGLVLTKFFPHIITEDIERSKIATKIIAVTLMILGLIAINT